MSPAIAAGRPSGLYWMSVPLMLKSKQAPGDNPAESTVRPSSCSTPRSERCDRFVETDFVMKFAAPVGGAPLRRPGDPLLADPWLCVPALRPVCLCRLRYTQ